MRLAGRTFKKLIIHPAYSQSLAFLLNAGRRVYFRLGFARAYMHPIADGVQQLYGEEIISGVYRLKGCDFGLTPSGDDCLAGLLIGRHVIQHLLGTDLIFAVSSRPSMPRPGVAICFPTRSSTGAVSVVTETAGTGVMPAGVAILERLPRDQKRQVTLQIQSQLALPAPQGAIDAPHLPLSALSACRAGRGGAARRTACHSISPLLRPGNHKSAAARADAPGTVDAPANGFYMKAGPRADRFLV
ncbi:hypothetical protein NKDENANG_02633 [Candidatus Entotheonellaceae bacterium PAL068K]